MEMPDTPRAYRIDGLHYEDDPEEAIVYILRVEVRSSPDALADYPEELARKLEEVARRIRTGEDTGDEVAVGRWDVVTNHPELVGGRGIEEALV